MVGSFMWDVSSLVWLVDLVVVTFFWNMYCLDGQIVTRNKQASQSYPGWSYRQIVIMFFKVIIDEFFGFRHFSEKSGHIPTLKAASKHKWTLFTTSKTDRHLLCQKVYQRNSVMNLNTLCFQRIGISIDVLSWRQQKHQCLFSLLRFFDVINHDPLLTF